MENVLSHTAQRKVLKPKAKAGIVQRRFQVYHWVDFWHIMASVRKGCWVFFMVLSVGYTYLCWCRANTNRTPHYTKLRGQTSANTIHHHGTGWGTLVLYAHITLPQQHLTPQCSSVAFWQIKTDWPTSLHWGKLLECLSKQANHMRTDLFQEWVKWLLLFSSSLCNLQHFTVSLHHGLFDQCRQ